MNELPNKRTVARGIVLFALCAGCNAILGNEKGELVSFDGGAGTAGDSGGASGSGGQSPASGGAPGSGGTTAAGGMNGTSGVPVSQLVGGYGHTCALLENGSVRCWGSGTNGQLGYGNSSTLTAPGGDVDVGGTVTQLSAGPRHTCALLENGSVRCWGQNDSGQLGYGDTNDVGDDETPASVGDVDVGGTVTQLSAGANHTCALLANGSVRCWGSGANGKLGYGDTDDLSAPGGDVDVGGPVAQIAAGGSHTCARLTSGSVRCWGAGTNGQLGYGNSSTLTAPGGDVDVGGPVAQIAAADSHTCALLTNGNVRCWGSGTFGKLGYGNGSTLTAPGGDVDVGGPVAQLALGIAHTCALLTSGGVRCWGHGEDGRLGYASTSNRLAPGDDVDVGGAVAQLGAGHSHTCALLTNGGVRCWGRGVYGQLGYGNTNTIGDDETPASAGNVNL